MHLGTELHQSSPRSDSKILRCRASADLVDGPGKERNVVSAAGRICLHCEGFDRTRRVADVARLAAVAVVCTCCVDHTTALYTPLHHIHDHLRQTQRGTCELHNPYSEVYLEMILFLGSHPIFFLEKTLVFFKKKIKDIRKPQILFQHSMNIRWYMYIHMMMLHDSFTTVAP